MKLQDLKSQMTDYAKDTKLNLGKVLSEDGAPDLAINQIFGVALASAYATRNPRVIEAVRGESEGIATEAEQRAAKAAAGIMAMNNVYYRFLHLVGDKEYGQLPANLRMQIIGNPGIERVDFELYSLAVSAINGCGSCIESHVQQVVKGGISKLGVQSAIRIAAVTHAAAQVMDIETGGNTASLENAA